MRLFTVCALALAATGCGANKLIYTKPSAGNEELQRSFAECRARSATLPQYRTPPASQPLPAGSPGSGYQAMGQGMSDLADSMYSVQVRQQFIDDCMRAQGWVREK